MNAPRKPRLLLGDILDAARDIQHYTKGLSEEQFVNDRSAVLIVERLLLIIGEAAMRLRRDYQYDQLYPHVPWHSIVSTRHIIAHLYDKVDTSRLYRIIANRIPALIEHIEAIKMEVDQSLEQL